MCVWCCIAWHALRWQLTEAAHTCIASIHASKAQERSRLCSWLLFPSLWCVLLVLLAPCCILSAQGLQNAPGRTTAADRAAEQAFTSYYDTAELYYAYHLIYTTANQPFKTVDDATLFNAARSVVADSAYVHPFRSAVQTDHSSMLPIVHHTRPRSQRLVQLILRLEFAATATQVSLDADIKAGPTQRHSAVQDSAGAGRPGARTARLQAGALCIQQATGAGAGACRGCGCGAGQSHAACMSLHRR